MLCSNSIVLNALCFVSVLNFFPLFTSVFFFRISCFLVVVSIHSIVVSLYVFISLFLRNQFHSTDVLFVYNLQFGHHHRKRLRHNDPMFNSCISCPFLILCCSKFTMNVSFSRWLVHACAEKQTDERMFFILRSAPFFGIKILGEFLRSRVEKRKHLPKRKK